MRQALTVRSTLWLAVLALALAAPAFAQVEVEPILGDHGPVIAHAEGAPSRPQAPNMLTGIYDNTASAANFGFSSTDLTAVWGDRLFTTGTGILSTHAFTIFNTGTSAGVLLTANVGVDFYDSATSTFLGGYTTNVNFGAGLGLGFYSIVNVPSLDPLLINLTTTDIIVLQTVLSKTGPANRLGIASLNPVTLGASPGSMYIAASTVGGGVPGFYNIGNPPLPANPGYALAVNPPPVSTKPTTWGRLKNLYR